ncbi:MAG TPA: recombinase RecA [Candidatus Sumerlaeota bacterium]|nr:recombinase RecA [Candidatus Sumerlaeota bacterium]HPS01023.1 recombinase RecA [Candidatus Sumerlaeota bacterium]
MAKTKPKTDAIDDASRERQKALELAMDRIERDFGKGSIMRFSERAHIRIPAIPSGALSLDVALGIGGYPRGRIVEIYGPESSGKTTLALHAVASAQRMGGVAAFIDAEHAMDPTYTRNLGVNLDELLISQPDSGEQALSIAEVLINSNAVDIVVIDSVAALVPKAEIEGEMGDSLPGLQARLMSQAMRKLTAAISRSNATMIFINQMREKIGVMYGSNETTTGGRALKFYASIRVDVRRIGGIKDATNATGNRVRAKVVKNKVAPPFRETEFDIMFGLGISTEGDLLDLAVENGLVQKSGAWFSMDGERLGQGRESSKEFLRAHPDIMKTLDTQLRAKLLADPTAEPAEPVAGE